MMMNRLINDFRRRQRSTGNGFTLIELLVVIAIIAILAAMLLPALARSKAQSYTAKCSSNMRNWNLALTMYIQDSQDHFCYFGEDSGDYQDPFWTMYLAPYLCQIAQTGIEFSSTAIFTNAIRMCPGGGYTLPPYCTGTWDPTDWNCWIGVNFGAFGSPLSGPFYYANTGTPPLAASSVMRPSAAMMFMDTITHYVYSPVDSGYAFTRDMNNDGILDTMTDYTDTAFNNAQPMVHDGGANVGALDGHVERIPFKILWAVDVAQSRKAGYSVVASPFWYMQYPNAEFAAP